MSFARRRCDAAAAYVRVRANHDYIFDLGGLQSIRTAIAQVCGEAWECVYVQGKGKQDGGPDFAGGV